MDYLQRPINEGGLNILDIKARNEAIEIIWLKSYLNFTSSRQQWAMITDHIVLAAAPTHTVEDARDNPFLQSWSMPSRGPRAKTLNDDIRRMFKTAKKYHTTMDTIRITLHLLSQLPAWYHLNADHHLLNNSQARCMIQKHNINKVADLLILSARLRHPCQYPTHQRIRGCRCWECAKDRTLGCKTHKSVQRKRLPE